MNKKEFEKLIQEYSNKGFEYGKPIKYLEFRNNATKQDFEKDLSDFEDLEIIEKQKRDGEVRHALYFIYSKNKGRVYVIKLAEKIRIITIYPLGRKTLNKFRKKGLYTEKP